MNLWLIFSTKEIVRLFSKQIVSLVAYFDRKQLDFSGWPSVVSSTCEVKDMNN